MADHYVVLRDVPVRVGGMSKVHCCTDSRSGKKVALKVIEGHQLTDRVEREIFERELNASLLRHKNIALILDSGIDEDSGHPYLVYDWVDSDLRKSGQGFARERPDDFLDKIGIPILDALVYAHLREVVHRDLKPSNILIDGAGVPILTDFGISKYRNRAPGTGPTLREFVSKPFAPPESDHSAGFSRDVFGFGVLMLWALADADVEDYPDFRAALDSIDAHPTLVEIIEDCCQLEVDQRPLNAIEVSDRVAALQNERRRIRTEVKTVHLWLTRTAALRVSEEEDGLLEVMALVNDELFDSPAIRPMENDNPDKPWQPGDRHYLVYGNRWRFHTILKHGDNKGSVIAAKRVGESECDDFRDRSFSSEYFRFVVDPPLNHLEASRALDSLMDQIELWESETAETAEGAEERRLFKEWEKQLDAREAFELRDANRYRFTRAEQDGRRLTLTLQKAPSEDLLNMSVQVLNEAGRFFCRGVVEDCRGHELVVYLSKLPRHSVTSGEVVQDDRASSIQRGREWNALTAVQHRAPGVLRQELADLIVHPELSEAPGESHSLSLEWHLDLDDAKRQAVNAVLCSKDFILVDGPPGTGKTAFIAELVAQTLVADPGARILLACQTHVALDNALVRITEVNPDFTTVRLGNPEFKKMSDAVLGMTVESRLEQWRERVELESEAYMEEAANREGITLESLRAAVHLRHLAELKRQVGELDDKAEVRWIQIRRSEALGITDHPPLTPDEVEDLEEEIQQFEERQKKLGWEVREIGQRPEVARHLAEIEEPAIPGKLQQLSDRLLEGSSNRDVMSDLVDFQARWRERIGGGSDFESVIVRSSQVVASTCMGLAGFRGIDQSEFDLCIIDEASKATVTETLLPLLRSRRWVLVGDERQLPPFLDPAFGDRQLIEEFDLEADEMGRSLFSRLRAGLRPECKHTLTHQHRMVDAIGSLISECFYDNALQNTAVPVPEWVGMTGLFQAQPVCWYSTELFSNRAEAQQDRSYRNNCEVQQLKTLLRNLDLVLAAQNCDEEIKVLLLAPYSAQVNAMRQSLQAMTLSSGNLSLEVNTVDAAQGREADVLLFSTTRSNSTDTIGFLENLPRANVALSRARYLLAIVGDAPFFSQVDSPFIRVLSHIRANPESCSVSVVEP